MEMEGRSGILQIADGVKSIARIDKTGAVVTAEGGSRFGEATRRRQRFTVSTLAAGVVVPIYSSTTQQFVLFNPAGSGIVVELEEAKVGYVSGTMVAGHMCYGYQPNAVATPPTGTALTPVNCLIGSQAQSACQAFYAATVTAFSYLDPMGNSQVVQAATQTNSPWTQVDLIDGKFAILPGAAFCIGANAASFVTAVLSLKWKELQQ